EPATPRKPLICQWHALCFTPGRRGVRHKECAMSRLVTACGAAALALTAGPALADSERGLYFGVGLGDYSTQIDNPDDLDDVDIDFDEDEDAKKLFGGFRFNPYVALQLDWFDFGESRMATDQLNISVDTDALGPNIVGTLP